MAANANINFVYVTSALRDSEELQYCQSDQRSVSYHFSTYKCYDHDPIVNPKSPFDENRP
jgi:hypothetical protein